MRKMTNDEQMWLDEYIRNEFNLGDVGSGVSDEMRLAIFESLEFQIFLLKKNWTRFREEITTSIRPVLMFLGLHR